MGVRLMRMTIPQYCGTHKPCIKNSNGCGEYGSPTKADDHPAILRDALAIL